MSLLTKNSTPAERRRGCAFAEKFENTQAVVQNGVTTINGTPTINNGGTFDGTNDYLSYAEPALSLEQDGNPISISVDFDVTINRGALQVITEFSPGLTANDSGMILIDTSNQVRFYYDNGAAIFTSAALTAGRHTVTMTWNGSSQRLAYLDGVALSGSTSGAGGITSLGTAIGARIDGTLKMQGTIYSVKYFNKVLTLQEALDIHNKNVYDYINDAVLDLPMDMERHDPTNTQTLDVSGNGNHGIFGDGSTSSTYPVKNSDRKGYNWTVADTEQRFNLGTGSDLDLFGESWTMSCWIKRTTTDKLNIFSNNFSFGANKGMTIYVNTDLTLGMFFGNSSSGGTTETIPLNTLSHVAVSYDQTNMVMYINGKLSVSSAETDVEELSPRENYIGGEDATGFQFTGDISGFKIWKKALTPTQIADLYQRELKQINDI